MNVFLNEILSQGKALDHLLTEILENFDQIFAPIRDIFASQRFSHFIFTGMGSSYFSCYVPYYMLKHQGFSVEMIEAGEFLLHGLPDKEKSKLSNTCVIMISQSGESGEIVQLLQQFSQLKSKPLVIGITNSPRSILAKQSDFQLLLHAGKEDTVTSKTYVNSILLLYFLAKTLSHIPFSRLEEEAVIKDCIHQISDLLSLNYEEDLSAEPIHRLNQLFGNEYQFIQILARGPSLATAHQAALNFKEVTKIHSEAAAISTFRHGGIESLTEHSKLIILSSSLKTHKLDNQFIRNIADKWQFGQILYITTQQLHEIDEDIRMNANILIYSINLQNEFLAPLIEIVILQRMIYQTTIKRGIIPGSFRFTQKITRGL